MLGMSRRFLARQHVRRFASMGDFEKRAAAYWTIDRSAWLSGGKEMPLSPDKPGVASFLRVLGLLSPDASMSADKLRKYHQINAMYLAIEHALAVPLRSTSRQPLRLVDLCTGSSSHLALLVSFAARRNWKRPAHVIAIDADPKRVETAKQRAMLLGFGPEALQYRTGAIREFTSWPELYASSFAEARDHAEPPHGVFALHACDTATDEAIAFGVESAADALLVAPCCQAELAASWKRMDRGHTLEPEDYGRGAASYAAAAAFVDDRHAFAAVHRMPHMRREVGASVTDSLRILLLRASGYSVKVGDFVSSEHTPKNSLITATRQRTGANGTPRTAKLARAVGLAEYRALRDATGGSGITLARLLGVDEDETP